VRLAVRNDWERVMAVMVERRLTPDESPGRAETASREGTAS
jgi:hypothetical protein